ncbi:MAG: phenylacetate-CoA oxygenase subunit PaaC [Chitinophagaceae bacterium]
MNSQQLYDYLLHLADNTLVLCQRNSEWCGHGPILEQDIAITNISLDLIGQSRSWFQYAAEIYNNENAGSSSFTPATEDSLAYLRDVRDFKNCLLTEQPNGDWGQTILRQFFFSTYQLLLFEKLQQSADKQVAAIAEKSLKEVIYHVRWSGEWVIRLGDGTAESRERMLNAFEALWPFTGELFIAAGYEAALVQQGIATDVKALQALWQQKVLEVFEEATLGDALREKKAKTAWTQTGGKTGVHTEQLGYILAEMQFLQRTYPNSEW